MVQLRFLRLASVSLLALSCACTTQVRVQRRHEITLETDPPGASLFRRKQLEEKEAIGEGPMVRRWTYKADRTEFNEWWWAVPMGLLGGAAIGIPLAPELDDSVRYPLAGGAVLGGVVALLACAKAQHSEGKETPRVLPSTITFSAAAPGRLEQHRKVVLLDTDVELLLHLPPDPNAAKVARRATRQTPPPWTAEPGPSRRIAVLEFRGSLDHPTLSALSDEVRRAALDATRGRGYAVMTRESMAAMLRDMGQSPECEEGECEVDTARSLGADLVLTGEIVQLAGTYVVALRLHETAKATLLAAGSARGKDSLELLDALRPAAEKLFR